MKPAVSLLTLATLIAFQPTSQAVADEFTDTYQAFQTAYKKKI
ncbi:hypothetical protein [Salinimonas marina]|nr:hypothetical protein [Salinimonas marina]